MTTVAPLLQDASLIWGVLGIVGPGESDDSNPFTIEAIAGGTHFGNPVPIVEAIHSLVTDWALTETVGAFRQAASAAGHDPAVLPIVLRVNGSLSETAQGDEATVVGSPEQAAEAIPRLAELGVTEILWSMDLPLEEQLGLLGQLVG